MRGTTTSERGGASLGDKAVRFAEGRNSLGDLSWGAAFRPRWAGTLIQQAQLGSLMREGPRGLMWGANFAPTAFANRTIARLAALAAIRRREVDYFPRAF